MLDPNLLAKIVRAAGDISHSEVIEIGPGPGGLTRAILAANPVHLTAVEKDARCLAALAPLVEHAAGRFTVIEQDALRLRLREVRAESVAAGHPRYVLANLPYNVGTELITQWIEEVAEHGPSVLSGFTVMLQKEVAERMVAQVGDAAYGRLSLLLQQYCDAAILFDVPPAAFTPPPKVMSSILRARILPTPREDVPLAALSQVVAAAFNQRRKMLRQSLKSLGGDPLALCAAADIDPTLRAEACDLAMFARLARAWIAARG